jgi:hypothetical protein
MPISNHKFPAGSCFERAVSIFSGALLLSGIASSLLAAYDVFLLHDSQEWLICYGSGGAASALAALVTILGASLHSPTITNSAIILMALSMAAQLCLAVFVEENGFSCAGPRCVVYEYLGLGVYALEALVMVFCCTLQCRYTQAAEAAEDLASEEVWQSRQQPLLGG